MGCRSNNKEDCTYGLIRIMSETCDFGKCGVAAPDPGFASFDARSKVAMMKYHEANMSGDKVDGQGDHTYNDQEGSSSNNDNANMSGDSMDGSGNHNEQEEEQEESDIDRDVVVGDGATDDMPDDTSSGDDEGVIEEDNEENEEE